MAESWVHPVTSAGEPGPAWIPLWRFRIAALLLLALGVLVVVIGYHYYSGAANSGGQITPTGQSGSAQLLHAAVHRLALHSTVGDTVTTASAP